MTSDSKEFVYYNELFDKIIIVDSYTPALLKVDMSFIAMFWEYVGEL